MVERCGKVIFFVVRCVIVARDPSTLRLTKDRRKGCSTGAQSASHVWLCVVFQRFLIHPTIDHKDFSAGVCNPKPKCRAFACYFPELQ